MTKKLEDAQIKWIRKRLNGDPRYSTGIFTELIIMYKELAANTAWEGWYRCFDPNGTSDNIMETRRKSLETHRKIHNTIDHLTKTLKKEEMKCLLEECMKISKGYNEIIESLIELKHRPTNIIFNENALKVYTDINIPEDIKINLSFGQKFLSPYECTDQNMHEIVAQLEMTIEQAIPDLRQLETSMDIHRILKNRDPYQMDGTKQWLKFINKRTRKFFEENENFFPTKSDKGGHTVVMSIEDYDNKLSILLSNEKYVEIEHDPLEGLIKTEKHLLQFLKHNRRTKDFFEGTATYEPRTLGLPKFYGLPKIHKDGIPLRPITATRGCVGFLLSKVFTRIIEDLFHRTVYHIRDSYEFAKFIQEAQISENDILVSFDVVSMFTSIPFDLIKNIIMKKQKDFLLEYHIPRDFLEAIINFTLRDCMIFTANTKTFKQMEGLPMGSCASPTLARLVMDEAIQVLEHKVPDITFIRVFVDDTIAAINKERVHEALEALNRFRPDEINFTIEKENQNKSINFLNLTLIRDEKRIKTKWYRKYFHSGRLLNYYSSHKRTTILGTAQHFIETVLILSDPEFYQENRHIVIETLRDNSFPETLIMAMMNKSYTYMRSLGKQESKPVSRGELINRYQLTTGIKTGNKYREVLKTALEQKSVEQDVKQLKSEIKDKKFVIFPHSICKNRLIKRVLYKNKKPDVTLADSTRNTKTTIIRTRKTITPKEKKTNLIIISGCQCHDKYKITKTRTNETGAIAAARIITRTNRCMEGFHAYNKVRFIRGLHYGGQTKYLLKYIQWKYRKNLDTLQEPFEFPNFHLRKLII